MSTASFPRRFAIVALAACWATQVYAVVPLLGDRKPQWPLKASRVLLSDEQIAHARELCDTDPHAKAVRDELVHDVEYYMAKSDEELRRMLPDGRVPRAFNVSTEGCPKHGKNIYKHGIYPWKLDVDHPFTVTCPVGGETYPSNDFGAYYRSDLEDETLLTGTHVDSARGWVSPSGEKYWFVGYACHWVWRNHWLPAVTKLSQAYVLTGDKRYARKAIAMLDRIAEVYPGMDYSKQSRYAELTNGAYNGKLINLIWETSTLRSMVTAYDLVFDALVGEDAIDLPWRSAAEIRANFEANFIEEGIDAVGRKHIRGNFGMHQSALAYTAVVRQNGPTKDILDTIFSESSPSIPNEGVSYSLYNLVYKDGMPYESSPGYCFGWVNNFVKLASALSKADIDLYEHPKMRLLFDAPLDIICARQFTPAIGDAGSINAQLIGPDAFAYEAAYRQFGDPRYAWFLKEAGDLKDRQIEKFEDLFEKSVAESARADADKYEHKPSSRVMDGYGLAVLNNANDSMAVAMYYGVRGGHGHFDRLNIELFAHGRRVSPDLGYPDFMNAFVPGIYSWSKTTINHNSLAIDKTSQRGNHPGHVLRFHNSRTVDVVDVDAAGTYAQAETYRRTLVLVDIDEDDSYLVDVFRVKGGEDHVLSIHGQEGAFQLTGAVLPPATTEGTLAGRDVDYGQLYDDPVLGKPGYKGSFGEYNGSGYQHFFNWQRVKPDNLVTGCWTLGGASGGQLRVHIPSHPSQELIIADAYVSPTQKVPTILKYVLARRDGNEAGNTFVTVWETAGGKPAIDRVELHEDAGHGAGCDRTVVLTVRRGDTTDTVAVAPTPGTSYSLGKDATSDAAVAVVSQRDGQTPQVFVAGGSQLSGKKIGKIVVPQTVAGLVTEADYAEKQIVVKVDNVPDDVSALIGRMVRIFNDKHSCIYRIGDVNADGDKLTIALAGSDVLTGRVKMDAVNPTALTITTKTRILHPHRWVGMRMVTEDLKHAVGILAVASQGLALVEGSDLQPFAVAGDGPGEKDAWVADFGVGDKVEIERSVYKAAD